jgi:hypothetical protein
MKSNNGSAPEALPIGRPPIVAPNIFNFIESETLNIPTNGSHRLSDLLSVFGG